MKRIVLAEDHAMIRDGLRLLLTTRADWTIVGETGDGRAVAEIVRQTEADLLLLDLDLPGCHGIQLAEQIKAERPDVKILILTGNAQLATVRTAMSAGADGYMLKHEDGGELLDAISLVLSGARYVSKALSQLPESEDRAGVASVTTREKEILALVANGYTSQQIADKLSLSVLTVRKHRQNLMSKLSLRNVAEVTAYAIRDGLALADRKA
ncbi:response regulator [Pararobbsia silviterrae]|uniref:DNA-binding response regulator n=1 Tax=Pararobbsia silviterrae TaxID=1792498 RepID=A0A494Y2Y8_9BURK|nr:response regulator transcription factor [Pararobbsia silviterrae]RKP55823.1 DNA-binding response regulator [Pararobbsia silviterrae]